MRTRSSASQQGQYPRPSLEKLLLRNRRAPHIDRDETVRPYPDIGQMAIFANQELIKTLPHQVSAASEPDTSFLKLSKTPQKEHCHIRVGHL